jgi:hypothetical protein
VPLKAERWRILEATEDQYTAMRGGGSGKFKLGAVYMLNKTKSSLLFALCVFALSGCTRGLLEANDYALEQFIVGTMGNLLLVAFTLVGIYFVFMASGEVANADQQKRSMMGYILLFLAFYLMLTRTLIWFHYQGRPDPPYMMPDYQRNLSGPDAQLPF